MTNSPGDKWVGGDVYDAYMGRWSRPLARLFIRWLHPHPAAHWLEVGCGTGALTSAICDLCEPASIVACDPSEPFIEHARIRVRDARASFGLAAANVLPRRNEGFDAVVSGLVLNFLPDLREAIASIRDRLRPGGTVAAYVWDYAEGVEFLQSFWEEAAASDASAAALDEGRRFPLCRKTALSSLFQEAGLLEVDTASLEIPTDFASFDDYWTP